jgi:L-asparaginase II
LRGSRRHATVFALENNCSGKQRDVACCSLCGLPKSSCLAYDHLQQIRAAGAHVHPEEKLVSGIDGCSAPNYTVPLDRLALGRASPRARRRRHGRCRDRRTP